MPSEPNNNLGTVCKSFDHRCYDTYRDAWRTVQKELKQTERFIHKWTGYNPISMHPYSTVSRSMVFGNERDLFVKKFNLGKIKMIILQLPLMMTSIGAVHTYALFSSERLARGYRVGSFR